MSTHLPVLNTASSLRSDGSRNYVHPADVRGRFTTRRHIGFLVLIAVLIALPWVRIGGQPAMFLDVEHRTFHLFGATFNAQDFWLVFFLLSGTGFSLFVVTTLWGRVWCGYACPQTVFLEGVYRTIERRIEGERQVRLRRNRGPWTWDKIWRKVLKQTLFVLVSLALAHVILSYFVSLPAVFAMVRQQPSDHPEAFAWVVGITGLTYFNFAWFREQLCLVICPYGRLQSILTDSDTLIIGYDTTRGEPRGKKKSDPSGDCVDCNRCVVVCPTGIDIRNGLQIDCIGCAACVDACNEIMTRAGKPQHLIRYDSLNGLAGKQKRVLRPRIALYAVLGVIGLAVAVFSFRKYSTYEAHLLRLPGLPYSTEGSRVLNSFELHLVNKGRTPMSLTLHTPKKVDTHIHYVLPSTPVRLSPFESTRVPIVAVMEKQDVRAGLQVEIDTLIENREKPERQVLKAAFLGPRWRAR